MSATTTPVAPVDSDAPSSSEAAAATASSTAAFEGSGGPVEGGGDGVDAETRGVAAPADLTRIEDAVEREDPCAVFSALEELSLNGTSFESIASLMGRIGEMLKASNHSVDEEIRDDWQTMATAMGDLAVAMRSGPNAKEAASKVITDPDYVSAQRSVDEWLDSHCD